MHKFKIAPNLFTVIPLSLCAVISGVLLLIGELKGVGNTASPAIIFPISILVLLFEMRSTYISESGICIRYHFLLINRKINWSRINCIEFVRQKEDRFVLISLDNCPTFREASQSKIGGYVCRHPIKVIAIRVPDNQRLDYLSMFNAFYPCTVSLEYQQSGNSPLH